jgi:hypothetical protein
MTMPIYIIVPPSQQRNISRNVTCLKIGTHLKSLRIGVFNPKDSPFFSMSTVLDLTSPNMSRDVFLHICSMERVN